MSDCTAGPTHHFLTRQCDKAMLETMSSHLVQCSCDAVKGRMFIRWNNRVVWPQLYLQCLRVHQKSLEIHSCQGNLFSMKNSTAYLSTAKGKSKQLMHWR